MRQILKSSSKLGLAAAILLLASACGGESQRDASPDEAASPLVEIEKIEAGDVCTHGGTMVINGLDKDKDGELSEDEIVSSTPICRTAPANGGGNGETPASPLIKTETLDVGDADCPNGGQRVLAGLDENEDGELSADEVNSTTLLCTEVGVCSGATPLELVNAEIAQDPLGQHEAGQEYEVRIELNQPIDESRLKIQDVAGALGSGPLAYEVDADNDHIAILTWAPTQAGNQRVLVMLTDDCSLIADDSSLPYVREPEARVRVTSEVDGLLNEGDTAEICWTSRNADKCEFYEFNALVEEVDLNGCMDIELTAAHIAEASTTMTYYIRCEGTDDDNVTSFSQDRADLHKVPGIQYFNGEQPMLLKAGGGSVSLYWDSFGMESCTLSDGTDSNPVDFVSKPDSDTTHTVEITETTTFELSCEDVFNNTHQSSVRYLVGPGILSMDGSASVATPANQWISVTWMSIDLDGTCDVKLSNNGHTLEYEDVAQQSPFENHGFTYRSSNLYKANLDLSNFDLSKEQVYEVTCYDADKTESHSMSIIK